MALRHPLMLKRWESALRELGGDGCGTGPRGDAARSRHAPEDFRALSEAEAVAALNARRFLAAVQQRRMECKR